MSAVLLLRITRDGIDATLMHRRRVRWAGTAPCAQPDNVAEAIAQIAAATSLPVRPRRLRVELAPPLIQVRQLQGLPPVRRRALQSLVALQVRRFFRYNGVPLVTDAAWEKRTRGQARAARAVAVDEPWLTAIAGGARAAGLRLETITPVEAGRHAPLELLSLDEQRHQHQIARVMIRRWLVATILVWFIAGGMVANRVIRESRWIERELAALAAPSQSVVTARRRLTDAARMVERLVDAEQERQLVAASLVATMMALPDSVYLTSFRVDTAGRGTITGAAKQAVQVVAALEQAGAVDGVRLTGPAVREVAAGHEWERFTIQFGQEERP